MEFLDLSREMLMEVTDYSKITNMDNIGYNGVLRKTWDRSGEYCTVHKALHILTKRGQDLERKTGT
jgi:hypothetical protein